jgi:hypothetical protein
MLTTRLSALAFLAAALSAAPVQAESLATAPFKVQVDQTLTLKLAQPADSVAIGNATVADVAIHDPTTLLVTGKAFGSTNLLVLDRAGRTIYSNRLAVTGGAEDQLTIVRGGGNYTYSCIDKCRPTPMVGDAPDHFGEVMASVSSKAAPAQGQ